MAQHNKEPPANKRYIIERVPATIPNTAVVEHLKTDLNWIVERPRSTVKGKGINARKKVFVWCRHPPSSDTVDMDGQTVNIREEVVFENFAKPAEDDFFKGMDQQKAARQILKSNNLETAKPFAYKILEKEPSDSQPVLPNTRATSRPAASAEAMPAITPALTTAFENSMAAAGLGASDIQKLVEDAQKQMKEQMAQFQAMMKTCTETMNTLKQAAGVKRRLPQEVALPREEEEDKMDEDEPPQVGLVADPH